MRILLVEDEEKVARFVTLGLRAEGLAIAPYEVQADRRVAIRSAIGNAQPGEVIVIAGKGHEDYQILGTTKVHFSDVETAKESLDA